MIQRCQVCGRRKGLKADGTVRSHHYRALLCFGAGAVPEGSGFDALAAALAHWRRIEGAASARFTEHRERRENMPLSAQFWHDWAYASRETGRIERRTARLKRREPKP